MTILSLLEALSKETPAPLTRRGAVRRLGSFGAGLALAAVPALTRWSGRAEASSAGSQSAVDALNLLVKIEWLSSSFYNAGLETTGLIPDADRSVYAQIHKQDFEHAQVWEEVLLANAEPKPAWDYTAGGTYPDIFSDYGKFQALAQSFEDLAVRAYQGQIAALMGDANNVMRAVRILSVQGRHASEARRMRSSKGWVTFGNSDSTPLATIYAGEENHMQMGVDVGNTAAGTQAFDEPLTAGDIQPILDSFVAVPSPS